jgi:hypothetical protein
MSEFFMRSLRNWAWGESGKSDNPEKEYKQSARAKFGIRVARLCQKHGISIMVNVKVTPKGIFPKYDDAVCWCNDFQEGEAKEEGA